MNCFCTVYNLDPECPNHQLLPVKPLTVEEYGLKLEWAFEPPTVEEYGVAIDMGKYLSRRLYDDLKAAQDYETAHTLCSAMHSPQDWSNPQCYFCSWAYRWYKFWDTVDEVICVTQDAETETEDCDCNCCNH